MHDNDPLNSLSYCKKHDPWVWVLGLQVGAKRQYIKIFSVLNFKIPSFPLPQ